VTKILKQQHTQLMRKKSFKKWPLPIDIVSFFFFFGSGTSYEIYGKPAATAHGCGGLPVKVNSIGKRIRITTSRVQNIYQMETKERQQVQTFGRKVEKNGPSWFIIIILRIIYFQ
jgi:hypothetical protein